MKKNKKNRETWWGIFKNMSRNIPGGNSLCGNFPNGTHQGLV